ncbi:MAG TPA: phosphoribosyltransferase domain-containing protein [Urbifossiella sp.]|nr:phosphoribosyltransferase domain-containing protein [Urbifossiella sp.]
MTRTVELPCGTLRLVVEAADRPLDHLCGFAARRSRKRGFVFVSRVLGKHVPVRPRVMADTHARLADKLRNLPGPVVVVALAETATGLGQGVFEELRRPDALFLHTTRYRLSRPLAFGFEEPHSHAPEHLLYEPADDLFRRAESLVLVDDEISTGRTLLNLAAAYRRLNPRGAAVHLVCLTDWLGARRAALAAELGGPVTVHSLLRGGFAFDPDPAFDPGPAPDVTGRGDLKDALLPTNHGRLGVRGPRDYDLDAMIADAGVKPGERLLVLGSGEFAHPPFRLARRLEERGWDVLFQSTTRSPLVGGGELGGVLEFADNTGDDMPNFLYNVAGRTYDRVLIGYETRPLPAAHRLPEMLGATVVNF